MLDFVVVSYNLKNKLWKSEAKEEKKTQNSQ